MIERFEVVLEDEKTAVVVDSSQVEEYGCCRQID